MDYYILNININGGSKVDYWLGKRKLAPIFYGQLKLETIRKKNGVDEAVKREAGYSIGPQAFIDAKRFVSVFDRVDEEKILFSIGDEDIYIFQQGGPLRENLEESDYKDNIKYFEIKLLKKVKIKDCPLVLVSIKANRYIQSGTFRDLNHERYLGNTKALEYLITDKFIEVSNYARYLQCLSSLEFETLIAKYLEEKGLFVPAYKGGFLKNFDLFCKNLSGKKVILGKNDVRPDASLSVQIKLNLTKDHKKDLERVGLFFCINSGIENEKIYDWRYLEKNITGNTRKWLETTLDWVKIAKK